MGTGILIMQTLDIAFITTREQSALGLPWRTEGWVSSSSLWACFLPGPLGPVFSLFCFYDFKISPLRSLGQWKVLHQTVPLPGP